MKKLLFLLFISIPFSHLSSQDEEDIYAKIEYEIEKRNSPNETITVDEISNGIFSAPVTINFYGNGGKDAYYYTWYFYKKADQQNPFARYTDKNIRYTFEEFGEFVIKLEVADKNSENVSEDTYSFRVAESYIDPPNYFSPGDTPGSNDEFRVAYKSIVEFKITIFNRWGVKLYESNDPSKGWDGKYKGKYVNTGVYYYVIYARGADGVKHTRKGDINILRSR